jgi:antitoxin YefM
MNIVNFSDARNNLKDVIDRVVQYADITVIARRDAPDAVIMSLDHYNSLVETVHLLGSPANAAHLTRSLSQLRSGQAKCRDLDLEERIDPKSEQPEESVHGRSV